MPSKERMKEYLKYLLFLDALRTHFAGCNHNAMDRSCVYDCFMEEIQSPSFSMKYDVTVRTYYKQRKEFTPEPTYFVKCPCVRHPETGVPIPLPESYIKEGGEYEELECLQKTGYWESLEDIDEYVSQYATDATLEFFLSKIPAQDCKD